MQIGPYTITGEIARGGMGVVYRAVERAADRDVAIKVLLQGERADPIQQRRFQREAEALGRLNHPNIVRVHAVGDQNGTPYIVMDFVAGRSLAERLEDGPLPPREAVQIVRKLANALQHAHEQGVVHRDVKPENVLLVDGEPRLTDFGLAQDLDARSRLTAVPRPRPMAVPSGRVRSSTCSRRWSATS